MQNQNKFVGNSLSLAPPPPFCHCICVAIFIILESQSEKLWDQNYKLCPQNYKLRPQNYKLRSQNYKLRPQNYKLRSQNYKLRPQNYKLRSQNYKLRPQNYKLRVQNLQVWQLKLISYNFLKRRFECTVNGSLQMVVMPSSLLQVVNSFVENLIQQLGQIVRTELHLVNRFATSMIVPSSLLQVVNSLFDTCSKLVSTSCKKWWKHISSKACERTYYNLLVAYNLCVFTWLCSLPSLVTSNFVLYRVASVISFVLKTFAEEAVYSYPAFGLFDHRDSAV